MDTLFSMANRLTYSDLGDVLQRSSHCAVEVVACYPGRPAVLFLLDDEYAAVRRPPGIAFAVLQTRVL